MADVKYTYEQAVSAMTNAHNAGDVENAKKIANYIKQNNLQPIVEENQNQPEVVTESPEAVESSYDYAIDKAKSGAANFVFSMIPDSILNNLLGVDPFNPEYYSEDMRAESFDYDRYNRDRQAAIDNAKEEFFNYKGIKPEGELERYLGTGVETVVSEGPLAFLGARSAAGSIVELLHSYTAALAGQYGAETFASVARDLGGGEGSQQVAATLGSLVGGTSTIPVRSGVSSAVTAASNVYQKNRELRNSVDSATEYVASSEVRQIIDKATQIQPDIDSVLKATVELQDEVPNLIIPPVAVLADNPIYRKNTEYLLRTNPEFYAKAKESLDNAKKAIDDRKTTLFGSSGPEADAKLKASLPADYTSGIRSAKKRIRSIDEQLEKTAEMVRTSTDYIDIGKRTDSLMKAKESAVRSKLSPKYNKILKDADSAGVVFPASSVGNVHKAYKALRSQDLFASFPTLSSKLNKRWAPKTVEPSKIIIPGAPQQRPTKQYKPVKLEEMDSLKRELNKAIRTVKDSTQRRVLSNLKQTLDLEIGKLPSEFSDSYKALDNEFYRELGIPKNKAEISQLDSAKFMSQAGAYLAKPEQAREFLGFVGDVGIPVVRDAILIKMKGSGLSSGGVFNNEGLLDPRKLAGFMGQNKALINTVPGLAEEFTDVKKLVENLTSVKARLDSEYNIKAKELGEGFYQAYHKKGLSTVSSEILDSAKGSQKYLKDIKNFEPETAKMAKQAVRASLLEKAMDSSVSTVDFIKQNQRAFSDWFGPTYMKNVEFIAANYDMISKINLDKMKFAVDYKDQDRFSENFGISFPQLQSVLRDRITNGMTKLAIIGSKISTSSVAAKRDSKVMELLLNPKALETIKQSVEKQRGNVLDEATLAKIANTINNTVYRGLYFSYQGSEPALEQVQSETFDF